MSDMFSSFFRRHSRTLTDDISPSNSLTSPADLASTAESNLHSVMALDASLEQILHISDAMIQGIRETVETASEGEGEVRNLLKLLLSLQEDFQGYFVYLSNLQNMIQFLESVEENESFQNCIRVVVANE